MPRNHQRSLLLDGMPRLVSDEIEQHRFKRLGQLLEVMGRGRWGVRRIQHWLNKVNLAIYSQKDVVGMLKQDDRFCNTGNGWRRA